VGCGSVNFGHGAWVQWGEVCGYGGMKPYSMMVGKTNLI
jgi:hypothetical protein